MSSSFIVLSYASITRRSKPLAWFNPGKLAEIKLLDYSYPEFEPTHKDVQKRYLEHFISYANKYHLPAILHIRSGIKEESISDRGVVDADEDAISILR